VSNLLYRLHRRGAKDQISRVDSGENLLSPDEVPKIPVRKKSVKISDQHNDANRRRIYAIAENLWLEQQLPKEEIRDYLFKQGHDKNIVNDVMATLALHQDVNYL